MVYPVETYPEATYPEAVYQEKVYGVRAFTPLMLSGLVAWYDASLEVVADGTALASITDRSGLNNHVLQATGAKQPVVKNAILNGKPVYRGDGADDRISAPFTVGAPWTQFTVFKQRVALPGGSAGVITAANSDGGHMFYASAGGAWQLYNGNNVVIVAIDLTMFHTVAVVWNGSNSKYKWDEGAITLCDVGATVNSPSGVSMFNRTNDTQPIPADIAEHIVVNRACTDSEVAAVMNYLQTKWGL